MHTSKQKPGDVVEVSLDLESEVGSLSFKKGRSVYPGAITGIREMIIGGQEEIRWEDVELQFCVQMTNEGDKVRLFYPYAEEEGGGGKRGRERRGRRGRKGGRGGRGGKRRRRRRRRAETSIESPKP